MDWKSVPGWFKVGMVFLLASLLLLPVMDIFLTLSILIISLLTSGEGGDFIIKLFDMKCSDLSCRGANTLAYLLIPIFFFLVGALLAWLYGKFKSRKKS